MVLRAFVVHYPTLLRGLGVGQSRLDQSIKFALIYQSYRFHWGSIPDPRVYMPGGGHAPLFVCSHKPLARQKRCNGGLIGYEDGGSVIQFNFCLI